MKRIFIAWLISLPLVILAQPNPTIQAFKAEKLFVEGRELFDRGDYAGAIELFNEVVQLNENHPMVFEMRGDAYYELERYQDALEDYRDASRIDPDNAEIRNNMGVVAARLGMYAAATSYFREALDINPDHETAQENLTKAQRKAQESSAFDGRIASNRTPNSTKTQIKQKFGSPTRNPRIPQRNTSKPNRTTQSTRKNPTRKNPTKPARFPSSYFADDGQIEVGEQTDPYLNIVKVQVTQSYTRVTFELESAGDDPFQVLLANKNSPNAFYITDRAMSRTYKLRNIQQLKGWPKEPYVLHPNDPPKIFVAEFERIDESMYIFHLLEGKQEREGTWDFWDVKLVDK